LQRQNTAACAQSLSAAESLGSDQVTYPRTAQEAGFDDGVRSCARADARWRLALESLMAYDCPSGSRFLTGKRRRAFDLPTSTESNCKHPCHERACAFLFLLYDFKTGMPCRK
jgi:hypothetical protein